jgi:hypothetical protein
VDKLKKIISENANSITVGLLIAGMILTIYLVGFKIKPEDKNLINVLSVVGTMASFFGLTITFIQIIALKEISVVTQTTIKDTKDRILLGISISDVTEALKLISEIDGYLGNQKYELARSKLLDLKEKLIQFKSSEEFKLIVQPNKIKEIIDMLNDHISTLHNVIFSEEEIKYEPGYINSQLQVISTYLSDFKNKIKYQTV